MTSLPAMKSKVLLVTLTIAVVEVLSASIRDQNGLGQVSPIGFNNTTATNSEQFSPYSTEADCPEGFIFIRHECNSCYKFTSTARAWQDASNLCKSLHPEAHLLFINSAEESTAVTTWLRQQNVGLCPLDRRYHYWIGGQRENHYNGATKFYWKTPAGNTRVMHYTRWAAGEPNNAGNKPESCAEFTDSSNFQWNDIECYTSQCSVCEYEP